MSNRPPTRRRWFTFTVRGNLAAIAWMAGCFGLIAARMRMGSEDQSVTGVAFVIGAWICAAVGVGALFGRPKTGLMVGLILIVIQVAIFFALWFGGLSISGSHK